MKRASATNFLARDVVRDRARMVSGWREIFSAPQIDRAQALVRRFGLGGLYDEQGLPTPHGSWPATP